MYIRDIPREVNSGHCPPASHILSLQTLLNLQLLVTKPGYPVLALLGNASQMYRVPWHFTSCSSMQQSSHKWCLGALLAIMESFWLEKTFWIIKSVSLTHSIPSLDHVTQCHIHTTLRCLHRWGLHLGSPFQCFAPISVKKFFLMSNLNLHWHNLRPCLTSHPSPPEGRDA